jgi:transcriptional regulator
MYVPRWSEMSDDDAFAAIAHIGAAHLVISTASDGFESVFVPLVVDRDRRRLRGHVARANGWWRQVAQPRPVLAIFGGPDAYVSPSWYPSKGVDGRVVPTWNYLHVHVHGSVAAIDDDGFVAGVVEALTRQHETPRHEPWHVSDAPDEYLATMRAAIVGIEISIDRIQGKAKFSQNKPAADIEGARQRLAEGDLRARELAEWMARRAAGPAAESAAAD